MNDPFNLRRFVDAQGPAYEQIRSELRHGEKQGHWMWFVFPQLRGLGHSQTAFVFGISGREEAVAYLAHPVLGPRLLECARLVNLIEERSIHQIFGYPDDLKFKSCMTLFAAVTTDHQVFTEALEKFFKGELDRATLRLLHTDG
jgi:uncharacterized protein (DUF1810 family)